MRDHIVQTGTTTVLDFGPIVRGATPIDLDVAGTKLWYTVKAKASDADADAKVTRTYTHGGAANGIAIILSGSKNTGTITIADDDATLLAVDETVLWEWSLLLEEPSGRRSTVERGIFKARPGVARPA